MQMISGIEHTHLVNFVKRIVGPHDAEDVAQTTYLKVHQHAGSFRAESQLRTWVFSIARHCALDLLRAKRRHPEQPLDHTVVSIDGEPVLRHGEWRIARQLLTQLAPRDRQALLAAATHDGMIGAARALGIGQYTFRSRLRRARRRLDRARRRLLRAA